MKIEDFFSLKPVQFRKSKRAGHRWHAPLERWRMRLRAEMKWNKLMDQRFREAYDAYVIKWLNWETYKWLKRTGEYVVLAVHKDEVTGEICRRKVKVDEWFMGVCKPSSFPFSKYSRGKGKTSYYPKNTRSYAVKRDQLLKELAEGRMNAHEVL